ncbi:MAG TPA: cytochrome C assembly protein [Euryarchaeota archaeon]|nr:cytochrome c biogenesis protein CcsA [archaeon BMS3Bbin15]HDL15094.1 cytochrome C assembly protein [Euryarchaeota archaeon]
MKKFIASLGVALVLFVYGAYNALIVFGKISSPGNVAMQEVYRNVFFHVPINVAAYLAFTITLGMSILYLKTRNLKYDIIAEKATKLGMLYITFTLLTGSVWAKAAWNSYWNWDPRETSALIMWFVYAVYFAFRGSIDEDSARARLSAVYGIFGYASAIFTVLSTRIFVSLHPASFTLSLPAPMQMVMGLMITASVIVFINLLYIEVKFASMKKRFERIKAKEV